MVVYQIIIRAMNFHKLLAYSFSLIQLFFFLLHEILGLKPKGKLYVLDIRIGIVARRRSLACHQG